MDWNSAPDSFDLLMSESLHQPVPFSEQYSPNNTPDYDNEREDNSDIEKPTSSQNNTNQMDVEVNPNQPGANYDQLYRTGIYLRDKPGKHTGALFDYIIRNCTEYNDPVNVQVFCRRVVWFIIHVENPSMQIRIYRQKNNKGILIQDSVKAQTKKEKDCGPHIHNGYTLYKYTFASPGHYCLQWLGQNQLVLKSVDIFVVKQTCNDDLPQKPAAQNEVSRAVEAQLPANNTMAQPVASPPLPPAQIVNVLLIASHSVEVLQANFQRVLQSSDFQKQLECNDKTELWSSEGIPHVNTVVAYEATYKTLRHIDLCAQIVDQVLVLIPREGNTTSISHFTTQLQDRNIQLYSNDTDALPIDATHIPSRLLKRIELWQTGSDFVKRISAVCVDPTNESLLGDYIIGFILECIPSRQLNIYWCFKIKVESAINLITDTAKTAMNIIKTCLENASRVVQYEGSAYGCCAVFVSGPAITRWILEHKKYEIGTKMQEQGLTLASIHEMTINDVETLMKDEKNKPFIGELFDLTQRMYHNGVPVFRPKETAPSVESRNLFAVLINAQQSFNMNEVEISLKDKKISDKEAKSIADHLIANTVLTSLDLRDNAIGAEGAKSIAKSIKTNTVLTNLNLRDNKISDEGAKSIAESLKSNTVLTSLHLGANGIGERGARFIAEGLKSSTALTSVDLEFNKISDEGAKLITRSLITNVVLTTLNLGGNQITSEGAKIIGESLKANIALANLDLGFNILKDAGAQSMAELLKSNIALTCLNLGGNQISDEGAKLIAKSLKTNKVLTGLNLHSNQIGDEFAKLIAESLKSNTTLIDLNLRVNKISAEGAKSIAEIIKSNTVLTSLNLHRNQIRYEGASFIAESLKSNTSLTSLNLGYNEIREEGTKLIEESLKSNTTLTRLNIGGNKVREEGSTSSVKSNITSVDLNLAQINDEGPKSIADTIKSNTVLNI